MNARTYKKIEASDTNIHVFYHKQTDQIIVGIVEDYQNGTLILLDLDKIETVIKYIKEDPEILQYNPFYVPGPPIPLKKNERKTHKIQGSLLEHLGELL